MGSEWINKIHHGHVLDVLKKMPDESVHCVVTSPPYWGLRDYGMDGQIGLEPTFDLYLERLIQIFTEIKRVLKKDGTCWVNIGDSYSNYKDCKSIGQTIAKNTSRENAHYIEKGKSVTRNSRMLKKMGLPDKSLCCIPFRFAIRMIDSGWILRNTIIWHKPNCMPSSVGDRFTVDFEYLFFFSKSNTALYWTNEKTMKLVDKQPLGIHGKEGEDWEWIECPNCESKGMTANGKMCKRCKGKGGIRRSFWTGHDYYFEQQFDQYNKPLNRWGGDRTRDTDYSKGDDFAVKERAGRERRPDGRGRNKRTVWSINVSRYPGTHFAVFPEELLVAPINAGCPEYICKKCGKPREKVYEYAEDENWGGNSARAGKTVEEMGGSGKWRGDRTVGRVKMGPMPRERGTIGYTDCGCGTGFRPG